MKNYAVFWGGSFGRQIKEQTRGYFKEYSRFHGATAICCDPKELNLYDSVEKKKVLLRKEKIMWDSPTLLSKRKYPVGTLLWGALGDSNPYVIFVPTASFEDAVKMVKEGFPETTARFTLADFIEEKKQRSWSVADEKKYSPLFGTEWMSKSELPPVEVFYLNGGKTFSSREEAEENQRSRWDSKPENVPGDWNTIITVRNWML